MFVAWRGYGLLGYIPPALAFAVSAFLSDHPTRAAALGGSLALAASGAALAVLGRWLNRNGNYHSFYWLPLWVWGIVYLVLGLAVCGWVGYLVHTVGWGR